MNASRKPFDLMVNYQASYGLLERKRHIKSEQKKLTRQTLEKKNINELRGLTNHEFQPEKFIGADDEEDRLYMKELSSGRARIIKNDKGAKIQSHLHNYGEVRDSHFLSPNVKR